MAVEAEAEAAVVATGAEAGAAVMAGGTAVHAKEYLLYFLKALGCSTSSAFLFVSRMESNRIKRLSHARYPIQLLNTKLRRLYARRID